jgi:hypothetical protein
MKRGVRVWILGLFEALCRILLRPPGTKTVESLENTFVSLCFIHRSKRTQNIYKPSMRTTFLKEQQTFIEGNGVPVIFKPHSGLLGEEQQFFIPVNQIASSAGYALHM